MRWRLESAGSGWSTTSTPPARSMQRSPRTREPRTSSPRRRPALPQLFVAHSETFDLQLPPQLEAQVAVRGRAQRPGRPAAARRSRSSPRSSACASRSTSSATPPRRPLPEVAAPGVAAQQQPGRRPPRRCWSAPAPTRGLELVRVGGDAGQTYDPRPALAAVEIVIGYGRSILEAMASGRAAYVYDHHGGDGWVTAETYAALEADGFAGRGPTASIDDARPARRPAPPTRPRWAPSTATWWSPITARTSTPRSWSSCCGRSRPSAATAAAARGDGAPGAPRVAGPGRGPGAAAGAGRKAARAR